MTTNNTPVTTPRSADTLGVAQDNDNDFGTPPDLTEYFNDYDFGTPPNLEEYISEGDFSDTIACALPDETNINPTNTPVSTPRSGNSNNDTGLQASLDFLYGHSPIMLETSVTSPIRRTGRSNTL